jgi:hypothetical protein
VRLEAALDQESSSRVVASPRQVVARWVPVLRDGDAGVGAGGGTEKPTRDMVADAGGRQASGYSAVAVNYTVTNM